MSNELTFNPSDIIVIEQLPAIKEQLLSIKPQINAIVAEAVALGEDEESLSIVKKKRAELNKISTAFEDRRKEIKRAVMKPYNDFEATYKECVIDALNEADAKLKAKVQSEENVVRGIKEERVVKYFDEYAASVGIDWLKFRDLAIIVKISDSENKLKELIRLRLEGISNDLALIGEMEFPFDKAEVIAEYKSVLNLNTAVQIVKSRHKAIEEEKAKQTVLAKDFVSEETKKAVQSQISSVLTVDAPTVKAPAENENEAQAKKTAGQPMFKATFTVTATIEELKLLKNYLNERGINYEC